MKTIKQMLTSIVSNAFNKCGYSEDLGVVTVSNRLDLCQFQCNGAFAAAKLFKKSPVIIANEVITFLINDNIFDCIEIAGNGFINITVSDKFLLKYVSNIMNDKHLGIPQAKNYETIVLDYGGPNVAKPLHIGHLRSAVIGESLKRLVKSTGRNAISDVHLGDWGLQMGLVIAELEERNPGWKCFSNNFSKENNIVNKLSANKLNEIYPYASKKSKENEEFKLKAQNVTAKLQKGNVGYIALWKEIINVSVADIKQNYEKLNVDFDLWYGESDSEKYVEKLINVLTNKGLLHESNGAMVVDVSYETDKTKIPPIIIKKSNDSNIYATTDLATIMQRQEEFKPNEIWYIVDSRQSLHFTQVFRCARMASLLPTQTNLEHLGFGTMNGSDGKPYKTRDGGVMQLLDFYNIVYNSIFEKTSSSEFNTNCDKEDIAKKITVATIKFSDLINHRQNDYNFDLEKFVSSEGKTGTFLLYTIARINSILKRAKINKASIQDIATVIYTDTERDLYMKIALSNMAFINAFEEKAPNYICENAYQLAVSFSKFYHENHILSEENEDKKTSWLKLCVFAKTMLIKHLDILGIESVESM